MTLNGHYRQLAAEIERLIRDENYEAAQVLLPNFAEAVVAACNERHSDQQFLAAKEFLRSAVISVRAHRAHYLVQLADVKRERAYSAAQASSAPPGLDIAG